MILADKIAKQITNYIAPGYTVFEEAGEYPASLNEKRYQKGRYKWV